MYQAMQVNAAAEAGMIYVLKNGFDPADVSGVTAAVVNATGATGVTATPAPTQFYGCAESGGIVETTEDSTCSDGSTSRPYVRINAALPRMTILPCPAFGLPDTLRAKSTIFYSGRSLNDSGRGESDAASASPPCGLSFRPPSQGTGSAASSWSSGVGLVCVSAPILDTT